MRLVKHGDGDGVDEPAGAGASVVVRQMHLADALHAVAHHRERVRGALVEIPALASQVHEQHRAPVLVEELHVHVSLRAAPLDVPRARYNRVRALVVLPTPTSNSVNHQHSAIAARE